MILISCRQNFSSTVDFNKHDDIRNDGQPMTEAQLVEAVRGKKVLILVHGYRNEMDKVEEAYARAQEMMRLSGLMAPDPEGYDMVLGYAWPGGWARLSFPIAVIRANKAGKRFRETLLKLQKAAGSIDVQAHSLGARVIMEALDRGGVTLRNVWLLAAAIDNEKVEKDEDYYEAAQSCSRLYVMHSEEDTVLGTAYPFADIPDFDRALGWKGPERPDKIAEHSPNTKVANCRQVVTSHGGYREAAEVYDYWRDELLTAKAPQFHELTKENVTTAAGGKT